jgi:hypothetical protein
MYSGRCLLSGLCLACRLLGGCITCVVEFQVLCLTMLAWVQPISLGCAPACCRLLLSCYSCILLPACQSRQLWSTSEYARCFYACILVFAWLLGRFMYVCICASKSLTPFVQGTSSHTGLAVSRVDIVNCGYSCGQHCMNLRWSHCAMHMPSEECVRMMHMLEVAFWDIARLAANVRHALRYRLQLLLLLVVCLACQPLGRTAGLTD